LALVLGGIEGPSLAQHAMAAGLLRGGWRGAVRIQRWNAGVPLVRCALNLMSTTRHETASDALVSHAIAYRQKHAGTPVVIIAVSGGCWVAVRALEKLGPERAVAGVVLLAPAISPGYDLRAAVAATRGGILTVRSPYDVVLLGLGTTLMGTSDRRFGWSAGNRGFVTVHERLHERVWRPADLRLGYLGSHCTSIAPEFLAREVTPWLRRPCGLAGERASCPAETW
jgi:pimeloyl-ACP methyl ester carboxylesterase